MEMRNQRDKKLVILALLFAAILFMMLSTQTAFAADGNVNDESELRVACSSSYSYSGDGDVILNNDIGVLNNQLIIERDLTLDLNGHMLTIDLPDAEGRSSNGIILDYDVRLTIIDSSISSSGKLNVTNRSTTGTNVDCGAGINCGRGELIIKSGTVNVTGGAFGAGIGGGFGKDNNKITITGSAVVNAKGGAYAAGIGVSQHGNGGDISISGDSVVHSQGNTQSTGIGGGNVVNIQISGNAEVYADGEGDDLGICGSTAILGSAAVYTEGYGGIWGTNIIITDDANLTVKGIGEYGIGIGGDNITISGGAVKINSMDRGIDANDDVSIIKGVLDITAGDDGICSGGYTSISGGAVTITCYATGILADRGNVSLSGGTVTVNSGGIRSYNGDVNISGGSGTVIGGIYCDGINSMNVASNVNIKGWDGDAYTVDTVVGSSGYNKFIAAANNASTALQNVRYGPVQVTVSFDANGGSGVMASEQVNQHSSYTIKENTFTRTGYTFTGWRLNNAVTGTQAPAGATINNIANDITLYAQWLISTYSVSCTVVNGNGTVSIASGSDPAQYGSDVVFSATPVSGYRVREWRDNGALVNGKNPSYKISNIAAAHAVTVEFELIPDIEIITSDLPDGKVGSYYSQTLIAEGTVPITWSINIGALPGGLMLNSSTGVISGTPVTAGKSTFIIKATNSPGSDFKELSITITEDKKADDDKKSDNRKKTDDIKAGKVSGVKTLPTLYIVKGKTAILPAAVQPYSAKNKTVTWKSADKKIVKVNTKTGKIKAGKKAGKSTTITVTTDDGKKTAKCKVYVVSKVKKLSKLTIKQKKAAKLSVGKTLQVKPKLKPKKATGIIPKYTSSNNAVAVIDKTGIITALKPGTTTITVKAGAKKKIFILTVT